MARQVSALEEAQLQQNKDGAWNSDVAVRSAMYYNHLEGRRGARRAEAVPGTATLSCTGRTQGLIHCSRGPPRSHAILAPGPSNIRNVKSPIAQSTA